MLDTSWEKTSSWYKKIVGESGHYYHQRIIIPHVLRLLNLKSNDSLLDLACGEGILERHIPREVKYTGIDLSGSLIKEARQKNNSDKHIFGLADISKPLPIKDIFSHASIILALQNIKKPFGVVRNAKEHLQKGGKFLIVLNHPIFRIPRQTSWEVDKNKKIQYRRIDAYMSHLEIPIWMNPGKGQKSETTWSFHYPLSAISEMLYDNGFVIEKIEEWTSDKVSTGGVAKMENLARKEFPLFMTILARKD